MTRRRYELTEYEWSVIQPLLPNKQRGVPRVDDRRVLNGILWRFRTGSPWAEIPERYGPPTTCYLADKGYDSNAIRALAAEKKAWANIPPRSNRKGSFAFSSWVYRQCTLVERFFNRIKQFRGIATRYDKDPLNFLAAVKLVALRIWCQP